MMELLCSGSIFPKGSQAEEIIIMEAGKTLKEENIILKPEEIATLEAEAQELQGKDRAACKTQFSSNFFLIPDDNEKTIVIMPDIPKAVLKVDITKAKILAEAIQNQIQEWL